METIEMTEMSRGREMMQTQTMETAKVQGEGGAKQGTPAECVGGRDTALAGCVVWQCARRHSESDTIAGQPRTAVTP
jgi:hypothetical protein